MYKLSIITAIGKLNDYNQFIDRYIQNILEQTIFDQSEIIIVYMQWHKKFDQLKKYTNIQFIHETDGNGMYNAWNIGLKHATGIYVTNWNIDDIRYIDANERKCNILQESPDIDLVYNYYIVSDDIKETYNNFNYNKHRTVNAYPDNAHEYVHSCCMNGPDPIWRLNIHKDVGYFDYQQYPSIADWDMWIRMAENGCKFKLIPEPLCLFFESPNSVSNKHNKIRDEIEKPRLYKQYESGFSKQSPVTWKQLNLQQNKKLSILILSMNRRKQYLDRLLNIIEPQKTNDVEVLTNIDDGEKSIGTKRNELLKQSGGDYICFVDDDDMVSADYIEKILTALESKPDCVGIHLLHKEDGILRGLTYHSLKYDTWWDEVNNENSNLKNYYRNPNHLNPVRRDYALQTGFPEINNGEDKWYSQNILKFLKTEEYIETPIYEYLVRTNKEC